MDTCCLIKLYATGNLASLLASLGWKIYVSRQVLAESYYILREDPEDPSQFLQEGIDVQAAVDGGLLLTCDVEEGEETDLYVRLATTLDDGEAACLAIAKSRCWLLATDDCKAIRLAGELGVGTMTTPEIIKCRADTTPVPDTDVAMMLRKIQVLARFVPRRGSPLYEWWKDLSDRLSG
jgi:hypothetical protein